VICGYALVVSVDRYLEGQDVPDVAENLKEGSQQGLNWKSVKTWLWRLLLCPTFRDVGLVYEKCATFVVPSVGGCRGYGKIVGVLGDVECGPCKGTGKCPACDGTGEILR